MILLINKMQQVVSLLGLIMINYLVLYDTEFHNNIFHWWGFQWFILLMLFLRVYLTDEDYDLFINETK
jgi:hypothetical protein